MDELLNMKVAELNDNVNRERIKSNFKKQMAGEKISVETKLKRKDGTLIPVEATSSMITVCGRKVLQAFIRDISERRKIEFERESLIAELKRTLNELKTLRGIVPICSECKKIKDHQRDWNHLEAYIENHSEASFSHGICPQCMKAIYGNERWYKKISNR